VLFHGDTFVLTSGILSISGFNGSNTLEEARIDEMIEHTRDLFKDIVTVRCEKDEAKKVG
jgi:hypothetical protein